MGSTCSKVSGPVRGPSAVPFFHLLSQLPLHLSVPRAVFGGGGSPGVLLSRPWGSGQAHVGVVSAESAAGAMFDGMPGAPWQLCLPSVFLIGGGEVY